jgi:hypothetical protein
MDVAGQHAKGAAGRAAHRTSVDNSAQLPPHRLDLVRDGHGPALAQQQLSHAKLATTEAHYLQRHTRGPDIRHTLDSFANGVSESGGKVSSSTAKAGVGGTD